MTCVSCDRCDRCDLRRLFEGSSIIRVNWLDFIICDHPVRVMLRFLPQLIAESITAAIVRLNHSIWPTGDNSHPTVDDIFLPCNVLGCIIFTTHDSATGIFDFHLYESIYRHLGWKIAIYRIFVVCARCKEWIIESRSQLFSSYSPSVLPVNSFNRCNISLQPRIRMTC